MENCERAARIAAAWVFAHTIRTGANSSRNALVPSWLLHARQVGVHLVDAADLHRAREPRPGGPAKALGDDSAIQRDGPDPGRRRF
jgi:hypothetical protein